MAALWIFTFYPLFFAPLMEMCYLEILQTQMWLHKQALNSSFIYNSYIIQREDLHYLLCQLLRGHLFVVIYIC